MSKTYLVSEELLRQVLDALDTANGFALDNNCDGKFNDEIEALRALLSKEPSEPHSWVQKTKDELERDNRSFMQPLYTKDTP